VGLTNGIAKLLLESRDYIAPSVETEATWLSIGTVDYFADYDFLRPYGFTNVIEHTKANSKNLCKTFASHLGYTDYMELDINQRADVKFDLNLPIPARLKNKFDLVWDAGSVEHVMNVNQAISNLIALAKVGGKIVHTQFIGDQTNAGYWTISPNFYLDFYPANGCNILKVALYNRHGATIDYREITRKTSRVGYLLPLSMSLAYHLKLMREDMVSKLLERSAIARRVRSSLNRRIPPLGQLVNRMLGRTETGKSDWGVIVIAEKVDDSTQESYLIQNIYRSTYNI
jgi:hypothetical protein